MKKRFIGITLAIFSMTLMLTGCNEDVLNSKSPVISVSDDENLKEIQNLIHEKVEEQIDSKDIDIVDLDGDNMPEYIVKYKTKQKNKPLRIMILSKDNGRLVVKDEIKNVGEDFVEITYRDINNDGKTEIIAGFKAGESLSKGISIYEFKDGKSTEVFEEYYSEYIVKDMNGNGKKDIILIKENEKEGKSYACLYMWKENGLEKTKKVEIDPTLDTREEIIKKLLEQ